MGKRWGNALGGWKKQPRRKNGQFGSGGTSSAKKAVSKKRSSSPSKKRMSKSKKAAITAGVVGGVAAGAAVHYGVGYRKMSKELARTGAISTKDMGGGVSVTTVREFKKYYTRVDHTAVDAMYNAGNNVVKVAAAGSQIWKPSFRAQVHSTHYIHQGDELLGYATDVVKGRRLHAENLYLKPSARGQRRVVAGLSKSMKSIHEEQVKAGRKIVISKYRSEDSERIVRNQARKLGKNKVIVKKRFDPGSESTKNITKAMDSHFQHTAKGNFKKVKASRAQKNGVVI